MTLRRDRCYFVLSEGDGLQHVPVPPIDAGAAGHLAQLENQRTFRALPMRTPPRNVLDAFAHSGPISQLISETRNMCRLNRRRIETTRTLLQKVGRARAAAALANLVVDHVANGGSRPQHGAPQSFDNFARQLRDRANRINPLTVIRDHAPHLDGEIQSAGNDLRNVLFGGDLSNAITTLVRNANTNDSGDVMFTFATIIRVSEIMVLAVRELEQTQHQRDTANTLYAHLQQPADANAVAKVASFLSNVNSGFEFVAHLAAVVSRSRLIQFVDNHGELDATARRLIRAMGQNLDGFDAEELIGHMRQGTPENTNRARSYIREHGYGGTNFARVIKSIGFVHALYTVSTSLRDGAAGGQTGTAGVSNVLSTGAAFATIAGPTFSLLGREGGAVSSHGFRMLCKGFASVAETAGNVFSVAGGVIAIVEGLDTISVGYRGGVNVDVTAVGGGACGVSSGVLLIAGTLACSPGLQAAGIIVGIVGIGLLALSAMRDHNEQLLVGLLDAVHQDRAFCRRIDADEAITRLLNMARGTDDDGGGISTPWTQWTVSRGNIVPSAIQPSDRHLYLDAVERNLHDSGYTTEQINEIFDA